MSNDRKESKKRALEKGESLSPNPSKRSVGFRVINFDRDWMTYKITTEEEAILLALRKQAKEVMDLFFRFEKLVTRYVEGKTPHSELLAIDEFVRYPFLPTSYFFAKGTIDVFLGKKLTIPTCYNHFKSLFWSHLNPKGLGWSLEKDRFTEDDEASPKRSDYNVKRLKSTMANKDGFSEEERKERLKSLVREIQTESPSDLAYVAKELERGFGFWGTLFPTSYSSTSGTEKEDYGRLLIDSLGYIPLTCIEFVYSSMFVNENDLLFDDCSFTDFYHMQRYRRAWNWTYPTHVDSQETVRTLVRFTRRIEEMKRFERELNRWYNDLGKEEGETRVYWGVKLPSELLSLVFKYLTPRLL